jgi:hypothetical protein
MQYRAVKSVLVFRASGHVLRLELVGATADGVPGAYDTLGRFDGRLGAVLMTECVVARHPSSPDLTGKVPSAVVVTAD